jgi:uridine phosphorylase
MDERFTAQMYINQYAAQRGITVEEIDVAPIVVISWSPGVVQALAETIEARPVPNWPWSKRYLFYTGQVAGQCISVAQVGLGAPATVTAMEEMIACGAQLFLGLGWAGSLQPTAPVGTFLIPTRCCVREEGTSRHYVDDDVEPVSDERLVTLLQTSAREEGAEVVSGSHWTTDAPYRELCSKIAAYKKDGIVGVDMETSAMYALGRFRNVPVCNLLVVSDEIWQEWKQIFRTPELKAATALAQRVILRVLESDALLGSEKTGGSPG